MLVNTSSRVVPSFTLNWTSAVIIGVVSSSYP
jgi:hypothetical protein